MKVTFKGTKSDRINSFNSLRNHSATPRLDRAAYSSEPGQRPTNFYEVLRPTTITMFEPSKPSTRDHKQRTTPPSTLIDHGQGSKYFISRITMMERQQKEDMATIERLRAENAQLKEDLEKMRELNKGLLKKQQVGPVSEIHYMYQDLFVTDLKRQMDSVSEEALSYRFQTETCKRELELLRRDYSMMQATLRRYRELVAIGQGGARESRDFMDSGSFVSGISSELDHFGSTGKSADSNLLMVPRQLKGLRQNLLSVSKAEGIELACLAIDKARDFKGICNQLAKAVRSIINCERCTLFLLDRQASEMHAGKNEKESKKLNMGKFWATFHIEKGQDVDEPAFLTLEEARKGLRNTDCLMHSICLEDRVLMTIQCSHKISKSNKARGFTSIDELLLKILGHLTKVHIQLAFAVHSAQTESEHTIQVVSIASELAMSRTHQELANQASKLLTAFFEFETAGIVFVDPYLEEFFMMAPAATGEGYSEDVVRFPKTLGLTGEVYLGGSIMQIDDVKKHIHYNPEVDNVAGSNELVSLMIGVIPGPKHKRIGVLQLGNKCHGQPLTQHDIRKFNALSGLLGACITCTNDLVETMSLTIHIKSCIDSIVKAVDKTESARIDVESGQVYNLINSIRTQIVDWNRIKKQRLQFISN